MYVIPQPIPLTNIAHLLGSINHQTIHHLLPGVLQSHYPKVAHIVRQTCADFGLEYIYTPTVFEAVASHISYLQNLGQNTYGNEFSCGRKKQWLNVHHEQYGKTFCDYYSYFLCALCTSPILFSFWGSIEFTFFIVFFWFFFVVFCLFVLFFFEANPTPSGKKVVTKMLVAWMQVDKSAK